jgi:hypothetical protein
MQVASPSAAPSATSFAVTVPWAASRSASAGDAPERAAPSASRASADPLNTASRQPTLPHAQTCPCPSIWMCPMSPAHPSVPR